MNNESLRNFFAPQSIAVIGASRQPGTIGYQIVHNLLEHRFEGVVYPVNPKATAIHSVPAFPSVSAIPGPVDLAMVVVPKQFVLDVVDECGRKGTKAAVIISAGFREIGGEGIERERQLVDLARSYEMRLVGPNCMGVLNTAPAVSMNATFAPTMPPPGPTSFMSQSGAMGVTILDYAYELGLGIHQFVSAGNKADVSANDLLEYWEEDPETRVILMYLENFGNPSKFTRIASRVSRRKPIVLVKSGRTVSGARAASSHTGALAATDVATDALLAQCGVIRVDTVGELFDVARSFEDVPLLTGNRVAIVTNAGGPGIIAADACESQGLEVVELTDSTLTALREAFPEEASVRNPVDMIASADPDSYRVALRAILSDPNVDAVIAAFVPPLTVSQPEVARAIVDVHRELPDKPLLAVLMGRAGLPEGRAQLQEAGVPAYIFPESPARALAAMNRYREWLERPTGAVARFDVDHDAAAEVMERVEVGVGGRVGELDALAIFSAYGISTVASRVARSADEAVAVAEEVGFPVVLKINSEEIGHKTDVGGVTVDVRTEEEVRAAFTGMMESVATSAPDADVDGILVQQFVKGGRETIVGVTHDPLFGPLIMFGLGGIYTEALKDVAFGLHPLSDVDAEEMVRSIRGFSILEGTRGEAPSDLGAIVETLQRVSQLVGDFEQISELDINPLLVFEDGSVAVDGLIRLAEADERIEWRHGLHAHA